MILPREPRATPLHPRAFARGGEGAGVGGSLPEPTEFPPTPVRIACAMLTDPPRRFAGGGEGHLP